MYRHQGLAVALTVGAQGGVTLRGVLARDRPGGAVGVWLVRHRLASPADFRQHIARQGAAAAGCVPSPETAEQVAFVRSYTSG